MTLKTLLRSWTVSCLITAVVVFLPVRASGQVPVEPGGSQNAEEDRVPAEEPDRSPQEALLPTVLATALEGTVELDGILGEEAWARATAATSFVAQQPTEGASAGEPTEVYVLFDEEALYIGARLFESDPSDIRGQLVRRDQEGQFDYFEVLLDSNLDRRTGFVFQVSARGGQSDILLFDDTSEDRTWDAVWESEVFRDDQGWSVEMRIPLSQLRYEPSAQPQTWGVNFTRRRVVSNELLQFALVSRLQQGLVSQSGRITGLVITEPPGGVELVPYLNSKTRSAPSDPGDPFFSGRESNVNVGGELTWSLGGNFNLNATFNPDFGQVESDPAVINLTAFETRFQERRPFFVEDRQLFDLPLSGGNQLFFSRRIGPRPAGDAGSGADFSEIPSSTTILGAAKLTGRTARGLSVGVLGAVTDREEGKAFDLEGGTMSRFPVEPRSQWGVIGLQQDYNEGDSQVGALFVALNRELEEGATYGSLPSSAFGVGVDVVHRWGDREWALLGFFGASHVRGDTAAIGRIQRDPTHYFDRPDSRWVSLDPSATHLTGAEWRLRLERQRGEHWTGAAWFGEVSPEMTVNDVGFTRDSESLNLGGQINYQEIQPGDLFRSYQLSLYTTRDWSHDALEDPWSARSWSDAQVQARFRFNVELEFLNFWRLSPYVGYFPAQQSRLQTRGGPVMEVPTYWESRLALSTDQRSSVNFRPTLTYQIFQDGGGHLWRAEMRTAFRPRSNWEIQLSPSFTHQRDNTQYAASTAAVPFEPTFGRRYLFADVDRRQLAIEARMDLAFSPNLTLQLFVQPFVASGDFLTYKQLSEPGSFRFDRFEEGTVVETPEGVVCQGGRTCEGESHLRYLDFEGDGATDYSFQDKDFNFRSLIVNAVLRWEFTRGSRLFVVWQRFQDERDPVGNFSLGRDLDALRAAPTENVFSVKVDYWLGL